MLDFTRDEVGEVKKDLRNSGFDYIKEDKYDILSFEYASSDLYSRTYFENIH